MEGALHMVHCAAEFDGAASARDSVDAEALALEPRRHRVHIGLRGAEALAELLRREPLPEARRFRIVLRVDPLIQFGLLLEAAGELQDDALHRQTRSGAAEIDAAASERMRGAGTSEDPAIIDGLNNTRTLLGAQRGNGGKNKQSGGQTVQEHASPLTGIKPTYRLENGHCEEYSVLVAGCRNSKTIWFTKMDRTSLLF